MIEDENIPNVKIGFILYHTSVQFIDIKNSRIGGRIKITNMNDTDNPFLPIPEENILVNYQDSVDIISYILEKHEYIYFF